LCLPHTCHCLPHLLHTHLLFPHLPLHCWPGTGPHTTHTLHTLHTTTPAPPACYRTWDWDSPALGPGLPGRHSCQLHTVLFVGPRLPPALPVALTFGHLSCHHLFRASNLQACPPHRTLGPHTHTTHTQGTHTGPTFVAHCTGLHLPHCTQVHTLHMTCFHTPPLDYTPFRAHSHLCDTCPHHTLPLHGGCPSWDTPHTHIPHLQPQHTSPDPTFSFAMRYRRRDSRIGTLTCRMICHAAHAACHLYFS